MATNPDGENGRERSTGGSFAPVFKEELEDVALRRGTAKNDDPYALPAFELERKSPTLDDILDQLREGKQDDLWKELSEESESTADDKGKCASGLVGLALSGGGIRSSSFNLGVLQALDRVGLFKYVDYLSTVSGGSYIGTYLSTCMLQDSGEDAKSHFPFPRATGLVEGNRLRHLRNYANYLAPGGKSDLLAIPIVLLRGVLINLIFFAPFILIFALMLSKLMNPGALRVPDDPSFEFFWSALIRESMGLTAADSPGLFSGHIVAGHPFSLSILAILLLFLLIYPIGHFVAEVLAVSRYSRASKRRERRLQWLLNLGRVLLVGLVLLFLELQPNILNTLASYRLDWIVEGILGLGFGLAAAAMFADKLSSRVELFGSRFGLALIGVGGVLALWVATLVLTIVSYKHMETWSWYWLALGGAIAVVYSLFFVDLNFTSIHKYYRDRLVQAFVAQVSPSGTPHGEVPRLSRLDMTRAPYHLINAAVQVRRKEKRYQRGRRTDFFFFSKRYCGGHRVGYCKTDLLESVALHLDVGTAMAVSGAAVAPRTAKLTNRPLIFFMGLLNVRLSYWLPNPRRLEGHKVDVRSKIYRKWLQFLKPGPFYLFWEAVRGLSEESRYLNLSDGGDIENLGVYELLRRQCRFIIVGDGEYDPDLSFAGLAEVIRMARIDFGFQIEFDGLDDIRSGQQQYAIGRIRYDEKREGVMLYLKSNLGGDYNLEVTLDEDRYRTSPERDDDRLFDVNPYVAHYRLQHPDFPHESAADQFFDGVQFESYRALGYQVAASALIAPRPSPEHERPELGSA